jgi:acyl-CoA synthetase (AMP-forming)/AMP-acid ligase II
MASAPPRESSAGIWSPGFLALVAAQFLLAVADNLLRWLIVPAGKERLGADAALALGLACFYLPYVVLAAPAGYLADRFGKRRILAACQFGQIVLLGLSAAAIVAGNFWLMFVLLTAVGAVETLYSPAKLGAIPELVSRTSLQAANAAINMTNNMGLIIGTVLGSVLYPGVGKTLGVLHWSLLLGLGFAGWAICLCVKRLPARDHRRAFPWNAVLRTFGDVRTLGRHRPLLLASLASAFFWSLAAMAQITGDKFITVELGLPQAYSGYMMGVLLVAVGLGGLLAGYFARGRVELGMVPLGAVGIAAGAMGVAFIPHGMAGTSAFYCLTAALLLMGTSAGLYSVPLQAFIQHEAPEASRGTILAARNFVIYVGILLASGSFWILARSGVSARGTFLVAGLMTLVLAAAALLSLRQTTRRFLARLMPWLAASDAEMPLPRHFLRMCHRMLRQPKIADSSGLQLTGSRLLIGTLALRRVLRRETDRSMPYVGVLLPPSVPGVVANAALMLDRRIAVNLNYTVSSAVLNDCIAQCGIRHVLTTPRLLERIPLEINAQVLYVEDLRGKITWRDKLIAALQTWLLPAVVLERWLGLTRIRDDDVLTVMFTSGSTGKPKGVMLTHRNIGSNVEAINQVIRLRQSDVLLGVLPLFHSFGYTTSMCLALRLAPRAVYHYTPLESRQIGRLCREHRVTILIATPTFLRNYLRRCEPEDFAALDVVIAGAERLSTELADAFAAKFGVRPVEGYGTTELSPVVSVNTPPSRDRNGRHGLREGTVGRPLPGIAAKVVDLASGGPLAPDQQGMLLIAGPCVMKGYLRQPESTAEVICDGWYKTGDLATIDAEGFIRLTGRLSRFSKIGGEMVPHLGVQEAILDVLGPIEEREALLAVTAVPDAARGERLVVLHTGLTLSGEEICRRLLAHGLPALWIPAADSYCQVPAIPLLGSGKLDLQRLKELALELYSSRSAC